MKEHIGQIKGGVTSCMHATQDQISRAFVAHQAPKLRKKEKQKREEELKAAVIIEVNEADQEQLDEIGNGDPKKGPMDQYVAPIDPSIPLKSTKKQQNIKDSVDKERAYKVGQYLARWMYKKNLPFNAINDDDFKQFCEALGRYGPDFKRPSQYMIREKMLLQEVERTMETKMNGRLDTQLHMAAYALNPYYSYATTSIFTDLEVMSALMEVIEQIYLDDDEKQNIALNIDLPMFKKKEGMFGKVVATKAISNANFNAGEWWATYGLKTPTLMYVALRILNLTTSSSGCERIWSAYEQVDAKRRNKLDVRRRDDLVYIQFNGRMMDKRKKYSSSCDILLAEDASMAQDWICEGAYVDEEEVDCNPFGSSEFVEVRRSQRMRELHEVEDFVSDEDESDHVVVNDDDIDYESDDDAVKEGHGNEDEEGDVMET